MKFYKNGELEDEKIVHALIQAAKDYENGEVVEVCDTLSEIIAAINEFEREFCGLRAKTKRPMIYLSVRCSNCGGNEDAWYHNSKSIKYMKDRTKDWVEFDSDIGLLTLCPECYEKYKNGEITF